MSTNDWLILGLAPGLHGGMLDPLMQRFGDITAVVAAGRRELREAGVKPGSVAGITQPDERLLERCREWLEEPGAQLVTWTDAEYPSLLRDICDAPAVLFVRGNATALTLPQLAIVGSRNATPGGCDTARNFAAHLGRAGFCITSGLALGIDAAAHGGALGAGASTVAVCATGPDRIYPARHADLAAAISVNGAVVTEFPPGSAPLRDRFPQRNRLISGMSVGTLVVEAGLRSGALITARLAGEQGREVFAVPGSIHNPVARGCHLLIRSGAKLVEESRDIIEELGGLLAGIDESVRQDDTQPRAASTRRRDPEYQRILEFMGWDPVTVDSLVNRSGLTAEQVSSMLLILELEGCVEPLAGGRYMQREEGPTR